MPITLLPTPPTRQDPDNFAERGDVFLASLPAFATEANALAAEVNAAEANVIGMTALVMPASDAALAAANYAGIWSTLSGSLPLPASVFHVGRFWILLAPLANVATSEPGVSNDWATESSDVGLIGYFPYEDPEDGWLAAEGGEFSRAAYPRLWAKAQLKGRVAVDAGDWAANPGKFFTGNGTTTFNVPDLRGTHLRGWDNGKGIDPGRDLSTSQAPQNATHTHTGTTGNHSADHTHAVTVNTTSLTGSVSHRESGPVGASGILSLGGITTQFDGGGAYTGSPTININATHAHTTTVGGASANHNHPFTTNASGGTENRVLTTAYLPCIKH